MPNWSARVVSPLIPRRRRGYEYLDDPRLDGHTVERALADVACANALFGGTRAVLMEVVAALHALDGREATLLDVGTGIGDIPTRIRRLAMREGVAMTVFAVERSEALAGAARVAGVPTVQADAVALPFPDRSIDIVMCSQVLHHFERAAGLTMLREMDRVARHRVIVSDLRRSWLAVAGIWLASFPLHFHPMSRHDGVLSVLRGFTHGELREMVREAVGRAPRIRDRIGFRTTAVWTPAGSAR